MCIVNGYATLKLHNYELFMAGYYSLNKLSCTDNITVAG
jgi:hypothetical protein